MIQEIRKHFWGYLLLILLLVVGVTSYMWFWPDRMAQRLIALGLGLVYFLWGIATHYKTKTMTSSIVTEYLAVAAIGSLIAIVITW